MRILLVLAVVLTLGACAQPACLREQPYHSAEEFPPLKAPPGLETPEPDPNYEVPEVENGPVGAHPEDAGVGEGELRCLEMPPRLET